MGYRVKHRKSPKSPWVVESHVFATLKEAELLRDFGMAITGDEAEVVCEECSEPVNTQFTKVKSA